jgi:hypothetical protein
MSLRRSAAAVLLVLPLLACQSSNPAAPMPSPTPTPEPAPTPVPTPVPTPTPAGAGPSDDRHSNDAVAGVTAGVHSYLRNGRLVQGSASSYRPGDTIYLNCTPRDVEGRPTGSHGPIQGWNLTGESSLTGCWRATDTNTFNPDVHLSEACGAGQITAWCTVDGFRSNGYKIRVNP